MSAMARRSVRSASPRRPRPAAGAFSALVVLCTLGAGALGAVWAADWPQFRGLHRDGVSAETGLLKSWPAAGPPVVWRVPAGEGYSHIAVADGRLYTLVGRGRDEILLCLDAVTGRTLWHFRAGDMLMNDMGNGPRSTPTVDGGMVYAWSSQGKLYALDAKSGREVWRHDLRQEIGAESPNWGIATSPLVEGELLLVEAGGNGNRTIAAFDKKSGRLAWTSLDDRPSYAAPIALTAAGVRQVVFLTASSLAAVAPSDGRLLWRVPWQTTFDVNASTPIFVPPDRVYVSSGYDTGAAVYRIRARGPRLETEEVWRSRVMKNQFSSSLLAGGYLYGFDNATFKCVDVNTGEEKWKQRGLGQGSLILADGHLIVLSDAGALLLVEPTPAAYREQARAQVLTGKSWTAPTLSGGRLYLRNEDAMVALDLRAPAATPRPH